MNNEYEQFRQSMYETYVEMGHKDIAILCYGTPEERCLQTHEEYLQEENLDKQKVSEL